MDTLFPEIRISVCNLLFKCLYKGDNIALLERTQHLHLSDRRLLHNLVLLCLFELLDGDCVAGLLVASLVYNAVGSLAYYPKDLVFIHFK